jgi:hypothetical protein
MKTLQKCDPWEESLVAYYIVMVLPLYPSAACFWTGAGRIGPPPVCMCAGTEEEPASQPAGCFIYSWQHNNNPCIYCLCYLVFFCTCHLNTGFQIIFWQLGLWKKGANGLLLCNSLLAKLNFEVNYEPQLPSQCTYLKEGYNLRTLERLLQWRTPHWLGLLGPSFFEVVCPPPLGACAMCGLIVHYFAGILMDCLCKYHKHTNCCFLISTHEIQSSK